MTRQALQIIENTYSIVLNPNQPYFEQLEHLGVYGELSEKNRLIKLVINLCETIDQQGIEIEKLKSLINNPPMPSSPPLG